MNITFGLTDYGKMNFMIKMADLENQKKKLEAQMNLEPEKRVMCTKMINDINL